MSDFSSSHKQPHTDVYHMQIKGNKIEIDQEITVFPRTYGSTQVTCVTLCLILGINQKHFIDMLGEGITG